MRTVLITGVAGFIGYNLALKLINNYKVIGIDKFNDSSSLKLKKKRIKNLKHKNFRFIEKDILSLKEKFDVDYVYHLAAVKLNDSNDNAKIIYKNNILATKKLFNLINKKELKKIIFSSSLYVYGNFKKIKTETDQCYPENNYGKSKYKGEKIFIKLFNKEKRINLTIFRIFFTYGKEQYSNNRGYPSVIHKNFSRLKKGKNPIIFNDGSQILDYSYIDDVINILKHPLKIKMNGIYNLCSGKGISILDLIKKMKKVMSVKKANVFKGNDNTANTLKIGNNKKLLNKIKFKHNVSMMSGLKKVFKNV